MYTLVSAIGKSFASAGRWLSIDIGDMTMTEIFATYTKVYAILTNPFVDGQVSLDLSQIQPTEGGLSTLTFNDFLTQNGNTTLPTSTTIPTLDPRYAEYKDAFRAGYHVQPVNSQAAIDAQLPASDKTWLHLTKTDAMGNSIDFNLFYQSIMVTVNGFFHNIDADATGAWVMDGDLSRTISKQNQIGLLNFQNLGTLKYIPITPQMIYKQSSNQLYRNQMHVNLGVDISNQTVMLVLGGYLHVLDGKTLSRVGEQLVLIDFNNLPLIQRYHESSKYLDFSALPFERNQNAPSLIAVPDFMSDENLIAYATMSQSFFVILDNPEIFVEYDMIQTTRLVGKLVSYQAPKYPLINGIGKVADYWYVYEDQKWAISVFDNYWHNRTYDTVDWRAENCLTDARQTQDPVRHSRAFFLKIGTDFDAGTVPAS